MPSTITSRLASLQGAEASLAIKPPCRVASTGTLTLSSTQVIDGVAVTTGDRVLVWNQSTSIENGIYQVNSSAWTRTADFDSSADVVYGSLVYVTTGTTYANRMFAVNSTGINTPGSSAITFMRTQFGASSTDSSTAINLLINRSYTAESSWVNTAVAIIATSTAIPTSTQGTSMIETASFTPQSSANTLRVTVLAHLNVAGGALGSMALFKGASTAAIAAAQTRTGTGQVHPALMVYEETATSTARSYNLRIGPQSTANQIFINGSSAVQMFGGLLKSSITIEEFST